MPRSGSRAALFGTVLLGAAAIGVVCLAPGAQAAPPEDQALQRVELWSGAEAFHRVWSLYGGGSFAPFGSIREDGLRVRAIAGYGDYGSGTVSFADLLIGDHRQFGSITVKIFAGLTVANHDADHPLSAPQGAGLGGKAVLEAWWNITDRTWASADLSWGSLHNTYGSRARLGWRLSPEFSIGFEGGSAGSLDTDIARVGGFARYEWANGEASVSGGLAIDGPRSDWEASHGAFGTFSVLTRF